MKEKIMKRHFLFFSMILGISGCGGGGGSSDGGGDTTPREPAPTEQIEHLSGGETSVSERNASAFSSKVANMSDVERIKDFNIGDDFFENPWVERRSTTSLRDGLGPHFNNNACQDCHVRDGRGHAPMVSDTEDGTDFDTMLIRASRTDVTESQRQQMQQGLLANVPDTSVGGQLQHKSNFNVRAEASLRVSYEEVPVSFEDGYTITLRRPLWHLNSLYADDGYDFNPDTVFSARVAPPMIGLGLLELIDQNDIVTQQDLEDSDNNGISGKANYVWNETSQQVELGRFGWKAGQPTLRQQAAGAFLGDMGLTSEIFSDENCLQHQSDCLLAPNGNGDSTEDYDFEVSTGILDRVEFYSQHLSVPIRRDAYSGIVQEGKTLFNDAGCAACHTPSYTTASNAEFPELSGQTIFPYTDLLLHDMGEDLADFDIDNNPVLGETLNEFLATTTEWRTPPLWGIGLSKTVDPEATFLHDGRARTLMEAVLWHGGEAQASKNTVLTFNAEQRDALNAFLDSL